MELPLTLAAVELKDLPTEDELIRLLRAHKDFLTKLAGGLFYAGKYPVIDQSQKMNRLLGVVVSLQQTIEAFEGRSNIAVPQLQMGQRPQ